MKEIVLFEKIIKLTDKHRARIMQKVRFTAYGCWEWTGSASQSGHGITSVGAYHSAVYRILYEMDRGAIPDGLHCDHLCCNPSCCNPWHLEVVTPQENSRRYASRQTSNRPDRCRRGHLYAEVGAVVCYRGTRSCKECIRQSYHNRMSTPEGRARIRTQKRLKRARRRDRDQAQLQSSP